MDDLALHPDDDFNVISLCAGGGGLDRAFELVVPTARTILYVERESFAAAGLVAQIEAGLVAPAAVWSDARTVPGRRLRGIVAGFLAGIPCQPHSLAGRRGGSDDERDLWAPRGARRTIAQARPLVVVIENVGGFLSARDDQVPGAERVWRDLQKLGYAVTGCIVRASDMGLPHERERVFVIGVADDAGGAWSDWWLRSAGPCLGSGELQDRGHGRALRPANDEVADAGNRGALREPGDVRSAAGEDRPGEEDGPERDARNGGSDFQPAGVGLADAGSSRLQGRRPRGSGAEGFAAAERGGRELVDAQGVGRREGRPEPEFRGGRGSAGCAGDQVGNADGAAEQWGCGKLPPEERPEARRGDHGPRSADHHVVDALGGGYDGRAEGAIGRPVGRDVEQQPGAGGDGSGVANADQPELCGFAPAGEQPLVQRDDGSRERPALRPPGPGDTAAWRVIAEDCPELLPALSQYDRFRIAMRDEGLVPDRPRPPSDLDAQARQERGVGGGAPGWVDAWTGEPVHPTRLQAAAQSALRRVADVMATRIDELRLLGNGVADAQGALAIRIGLEDLAARGSAGAAQLVRMMEGEAA